MGSCLALGSLLISPGPGEMAQLSACFQAELSETDLPVLGDAAWRGAARQRLDRQVLNQDAGRKLGTPDPTHPRGPRPSVS